MSKFLNATSCNKFNDNISGKTILFNDDPEKFIILYEPTKKELRELLVYYVGRRIEEIWAPLTSVVNAKGRSSLLAFTPHVGNRVVSIRGEAVAKRFPDLYFNPGKGKSWDGIHKHLCQLPLETQSEILNSLKPTTYAELSALFTVHKLYGSFAYDPLSLINRAKNFPDLLEILVNEILNRETLNVARNKDSPIAARHQDILLLCALKDWILLPVRYGSVGVYGNYNRFFASGCFLEKSHIELIGTAYQMIGATVRDSEGGLRALRTFFCSSNIRSVDDLSPAILRHFEQSVASKIPGDTQAKSGAYVVGDILRTIFEKKRPGHVFPAYRINKELAHLNKGSPTFQRVVVLYPNCRELEGWAKLFAQYVAVRERRILKHVVYLLWIFIDYLAGLDSPPSSPALVVRQTHINDKSRVNKNTFYEYLQNKAGAVRPKNGALQELRRFFDWYMDFEIATEKSVRLLTNPVLVDDILGGTLPSSGMTSRQALPEFILEAIKETIVSNDFAFPKSRDVDYFETLDELGRPTRIWYPGTAVCLYFLLDQPVRLKQARWLDDGAFDERTIIIDTEKDESIKNLGHRYDVNHNKKKVKGRQQGVLRGIRDLGRMDSFVGLFINTNKTDEYDGNAPNGYEIPYISPLTLDLILMLRDWNIKWMPPLLDLVPYLDGEELNDRYRNKVPLVSPLFRDPIGSTRKRPISDHRLRRFYVDVLIETERRLKEKGYTGENGYDVQLVRKNQQRSGKCYVAPMHDIHSLRVSGITALLMRGVPIEVVSRYVANHKTLTMTLWYMKPSIGHCRDLLLDAYGARRKAFEAINGDFAKSAELQSNWEAYSKHFLSNNALLNRGDPSSALSESKGNWRIQADGICPGGDCMTGFLYASEKGKGYYGAVPGGMNCSLCRYWITGPMFLLGQVIRMNEVMYAIERKNSDFRKLKDAAREKEATGNWTELHPIRTRIHELETELEIHVNDWHTRLRFVTASRQQLDDYLKRRGKKSQLDNSAVVPLISTISLEELSMSLEHTDSFVLLDSISQGIELMPGIANSQASLDHQRLLNAILRKGGVKHLLLDLQDDVAREVGNMLSAHLIKAATSNGVNIENLISGKIKLQELMVYKCGEPLSLLEDLNSIFDDISVAKRTLQN